MTDNSGNLSLNNPPSGLAPRPLDRRRVPRNGRVPLKRDLSALAEKTFDLVVVGGGAFGAWAAYDAAQRGLSVALLERGDFGAGTSAHALRAAHASEPVSLGSPKAMRRTATERGDLMRVAPHLVRPLGLMVPHYGGGAWSLLRMGLNVVVRAAASAGVGRKQHDPARRDRWGGVWWTNRLRATLPDLPRRGLAGGEQMPRLQVIHPERLVLAVVQSAVSQGAVVLNHAEVDSLQMEGDAVTAVNVSDRYSGGHFSVSARAVLNATGPDAGDLLLRGNRAIELPAAAGGDELMLVINRRLVKAGRALAMPVGTDGRRLVVAALDDGGSLLGPWPLEKSDDHAAAVKACLAAANRACPVWRLRSEEVRCLSVARVPRVARGDEAAELIDHAERDGVTGLFSMIGRRYPAAHVGAAAALDLVLDRLELPEAAARTTGVALVGADTVSMAALSEELAAVAPSGLAHLTRAAVLTRYGTHASELFRAAIAADTDYILPGTEVLAAELYHAEACEGAVTLADAVLRRGGLGVWGDFGQGVSSAAEIFADARGWSEAERAEQMRRLQAEIAEHTLSSTIDEPSLGPSVSDTEHAA